MQERLFRRKIREDLLRWKETGDPGKVLLLQGAAFVGKTTELRSLSGSVWLDSLYLDMEKAGGKVLEILRDHLTVPEQLRLLERETGARLSIPNGKALIILDGIQAHPELRTAASRIAREGHARVLMASRGLLPPMPEIGEEERITMRPMDYEEFRWALGDMATVPMLRSLWQRKLPLESAHANAMEGITEYMEVGGIPMVVAAYLSRHRFQDAEQVKKDIIRGFEEACLRDDPGGGTLKFVRHIPGEILRKAPRFVPREMISKDGDHEIKDQISQLIQTGTIGRIPHQKHPERGFDDISAQSRFRLFFTDTGILSTIFREGMYHIPERDAKAGEGRIPELRIRNALFRNLTAQMLTSGQKRLAYCSWARDDSHSYSVDFLVQDGSRIIPIEVNASGYSTHTSVDAFTRRFPDCVSHPFLVYCKDLRKDGETWQIPPYMVPFI